MSSVDKFSTVETSQSFTPYILVNKLNKKTNKQMTKWKMTEKM